MCIRGRLTGRGVAAGIVVVGAAGNDGDVAFVTGGPGLAPSAIGVASSVGPGQLGDRVQAIVDGAVEDIEALESHPSLAVRMVGIGRLQGQAIWLGRGCAADALPADVGGRVALILRGGCTFREKIIRAAAAGAGAAACVLMYSQPEGGRLTEASRERLRAMAETHDGFEIARRDLEIRGPGEFLGARQSGAALLRFADLATDTALLEWARVFDNYYGTPRAPVEAAIASGKDVLFDIDWQGAQQLSEKMPGDIVRVFVLPPSGKVLEQRLNTRAVSYTHLRAHETVLDPVCRLLLDKTKQ